MYHQIIKPLFFLFEPEKAHHLAMNGLTLANKLGLLGLFFKNQPKATTEIAGLTFQNKIGLAAGFDKDAVYLDLFAKLGFGHVEIGTVTPKPQPGNEKPRLFRLVKDDALINRMGFNNQGVDVVAYRLKNKPQNLIVGANIGKNKTTPNEDALSDYLICFEKLYPYADYFTVNVSSPNTPGLRDLQGIQFLTQLATALQQFKAKQEKQKPVFLKIAPDLSNEQLLEIADFINQSFFDGIVATNTTINRQNLRTNSAEIESIGLGGLSGIPLHNRSVEVVSLLKSKLSNSKTIIGVGGIFSANDALKMHQAGASLVQIYTGFIYQGPSLVAQINRLLKA